jgi:hypothetical protein
MHKTFIALALLAPALLAAQAADATTPVEIQSTLDAAARKAAPGFAGFSAARGALFFKTAHANEWSCASCHTSNPVAPGRHAKTGKDITPLAPAANPARFTDAAKADKWFKRNCNDVLGRECTAAEKGDVLAYLLALGR